MATDLHTPAACVSPERCICECRYCKLHHTDSPLRKSKLDTLRDLFEEDA